MPVPSSLDDLSTTPALNYPAGSESPSTADDYLRAHAALVKQVDNKAEGLRTDLAAAAGSSLVGFQQAGLGAVTTVAAALNAVLSSGSPHHKELKVEFERLAGSNFPQGFFVDEVEGRAYVSHARGADAETKYAVYNWTTGDLLGWFTAGAADFPEGFAVVHEAGQKYLYTRSTSGAEGPVGKYNITAVSLSGGAAALSTSFDVGMHYQMSWDGSRFYIEQSQSVGTFFDRGGIAQYDAAFNLIGVFKLPPSYFGSGKFPNLPKKQSFAVRGGLVALGMGGVGAGQPDSAALQGCRVLNLAGELVSESLHNFAGFVANVNAISTVGGATYTENEGVCIDSAGRVFTLFVANTGGRTLKVLREFCFPSASTRDFTNSAASHPGYLGGESVYPQRNGGQLRKQLTGAALNSVGDIFREMRELGLRRYEFYTSAVATVSIDGANNLPAFARATIYNLNNSTGFLHVETAAGLNRYLLQHTDATDAFTATLASVTPNIIADANDVALFPNGQYRTTSATLNIPGTFGMLTIERYDGASIYQQFTPSQNATNTHRQYYRKRNSSTGVWTDWYERWGTNNTIVDANGFIKVAP